MAPDVFVRRARPQDAAAIARLNNSFANEGQMLLRTPEMISLAIDDYVVVQGPRRELLGCGALKELDSHHAEIKSMRTSSAHLRRGVASHLLTYILEEAARRGYARLSLETGSAEAFEPAQRLYARFGFDYCGPFGDYVEDPYSVFMTKEL